MDPILFFIFLFLFVAGGILTCILFRQAIYLFFFLVIISMVTADRTSITFLSHEWYETTSWGLSITLADLCGVILAVMLFLRPKEFHFCWWPPLMIPFLLYIAIEIIAWAPNIGQEMPYHSLNLYSEGSINLGLIPLFDLWKSIRLLFLYWVMANFLTAKGAYRVLIITLSFSICCLLVVAFYQRYVLGMNAIAAGFAHFHMLGGYSGTVGLFLLPFVFYYRTISKKLMLLAVCCMGLLLIIFTMGRASFAAYFLIGAFSVLIGLRRFPTFSNLFAVSGLGFLALLFSLKAYNTMIARLVSQPISEGLTTRMAAYDLALQLGQENLFGVGSGNFGAWSLNYADGELAHNTFLLTFAELGIFGVLILAYIYLKVFRMCYVALKANRKNPVLFTILLAAVSAVFFLLFQDMFHFSSRGYVLAFLQQLMYASIARIYVNAEDMTEVDLKNPPRKSRLVPLAA